MPSAVSTQIQLVSRPEGWPTDSDFRTVSIELTELAEGEIRIANEFVSVDPYMRGRMIDRESYAPPYALGETMTGGAVGRVVESRSEDAPVGALVSSQWGWRDVAQGPASAVRVLPENDLSPSVYLGVLGMTSFAAYVGLTAVGRMREGEVVFVSGAAGAVGSAAGQIARLLGASRVVGSAGSAEKVARIVDGYRFDAGFDYHDGPVTDQLAAAAPDGIDVYFDNVGGDHLEAAIEAFRREGRGALCGSIASYNDTEPTPGPRNMSRIITHSLELKGFTIGSYLSLYPEFLQRMTGWFQAGEIAYDETIVEGLENATAAFLDMMRGKNLGKMVVRVG
jgi:NADPH-dependent curcumin reductase CurA